LLKEFNFPFKGESKQGSK